jgi:hypothetical protein
MLDEARFYFSNQHEQIWLPEDEDSPTNTRPMISSPKALLTILWNPHGFHVVKILPTGCKWTSPDSVDRRFPEICALHIAGGQRKLVVHADNARPHVSTRVQQDMESHSVRRDCIHPLPRIEHRATSSSSVT